MFFDKRETTEDRSTASVNNWPYHFHAFCKYSPEAVQNCEINLLADDIIFHGKLKYVESYKNNLTEISNTMAGNKMRLITGKT